MWPSQPEFWSRPGLVPKLLQPLALAYGAAGAARRTWTAPFHAAVPVICVGNLVVGGAGKTPVVESLARILAARGRLPHILSRGYGGTETGPMAVDAARHRAAEIGDEPLLLARAAPVWVARDRVAGAKAAIAAGASCILLDDGYQNPSLGKDLSLLVIDGAYGFGNGHVLPAGPLRESVRSGLARADAIVLLGEDRHGLGAVLPKPVLHAGLVALNAQEFAGRDVVAFAGIGRPEKFFASLEAAHATLSARRAFPDHHPYRESELRHLAEKARAAGAILVTTEKDWVRLSPAWQTRVQTLRVEITWRDRDALDRLLARL
jgi:tetraacyldisaccharide 4'-kinase